MQAVILAAGIGSRLQPLTEHIPKPLVPVSFRNGRVVTIIDKLLEQIKAAGISEVFVVVNYKKEMIERYLGDGSAFSMGIKYVLQDELDGNGGALFRCQSFVKQDILFTDCDNFVDDEKVFLHMREVFEKSGSDAAVGVKKVQDIKRYAIFKTDRSGKIVDIFEKPTDEKEWGNLAKTGFGIVSEKIMKLNKGVCRTEKGEYATTQLFKHMIDNGMSVVPFLVEADFEDIGTWESYSRILGKNHFNLSR